MTRKKTTHIAKDKSFGLNPHIVKMLPQKYENFFLSLIDKHFPPHHKLHKLFNQNNVKINYSCLPNIKSIINAHNRKILYPSPVIGRRTCNCINIPQRPLQQKCLSNNILYQANITTIGENSETKVYYGIYETTFKLR